LHTLRVVVDVEQEVPSITEIVPAAVFYENEMKEVFGVFSFSLSWSKGSNE
ncbi:MAG: NADH-quinone oxidoreductase subunit C, partial [Oscillospiraceae bacterium]|nr:NADH-quinone oxidoreductase subunit C [Oscillospiraceae bacterium]